MLRRQQRTEHRKALLAVTAAVVAIIIVTLMPGCEGLINGTPSEGFDVTKLDAEEAGYYQEMSSSIIAWERSAKGLYEALQDYDKYLNMHDDEKIKKSMTKAVSECMNMQNYRDPDNPYLKVKMDWGKLNRILPPSTMEDMHYAFIKLYQDNTEPWFALEPCLHEFSEREVRRNHSLAFLNAVHKIRKDLSERPVAKRATNPNPTNPVNVVFQPLYSPVSIGVDTDGKASFTVELSISTPVGDFSISEANPPSTGIKKMVMRSNGKERYFNLESSSIKVFVPPNYGVMITSDEEVLYLDVKSSL